MIRDPRDTSHNDLTKLNKDPEASIYTYAPRWKYMAVSICLTTAMLLPVFVMELEIASLFVTFSNAFLKIFLAFLAVDQITSVVRSQNLENGEMRDALTFFFCICGSCAMPAWALGAWFGTKNGSVGS